MPKALTVAGLKLPGQSSAVRLEARGNKAIAACSTDRNDQVTFSAFDSNLVSMKQTNLFLTDCYFLSYLMLCKWGSSFISLAAGGRRQEGSNCGVLNRSQWSGNYFCIGFKFGVNETNFVWLNTMKKIFIFLHQWKPLFISQNLHTINNYISRWTLTLFSQHFDLNFSTGRWRCCTIEDLNILISLFLSLSLSFSLSISLSPLASCLLPQGWWTSCLIYIA